jgi:pimeloyl-ACP methyl ester carboxylesterase
MTRPLEWPEPAQAGAAPAARDGDLDFVAFPGDGVDLYARVFVPGACPCDGVALFHGLPGVELNLDLAHALRRAGFLVLLPHYRVSWGMPGDFSLAHVLADASAAAAFMGSDRFRQAYGPLRSLALVGHSMGGFAALMAGARCAADRVVSVAGFNFGGYAAARRRGDPAGADLDWASFIPPLRGTSAEALAWEARERPVEWDLAALGPAYRGRRVLLVCGERDAAVAPGLHHDPVATAFRGAGARLSEIRLDAGHGFIDLRLELAGALIEYLRS